MSRIRKRYVAAAAAVMVAGTTVLASPASALSFQQIQSTAKDGTVTANCFFQVQYVSLVTGTVYGKMNGQAQAANFFKGLSATDTLIACALYPDNGGTPAQIANAHAGQSAQTGIHLVSVPLSAHYELCTLGRQNYANHTVDVVGHCVTTP